MTDVTPLQGELQTQIMSAVWRLEEGTVEQIRRALPEANQGAYNTVQTVLFRLHDKKSVERRLQDNPHLAVNMLKTMSSRLRDRGPSAQPEPDA